MMRERKMKVGEKQICFPPTRFLSILLWVEFSLYPYQKGFILPSIPFPIFR